MAVKYLQRTFYYSDEDGTNKEYEDRQLAEKRDRTVRIKALFERFLDTHPEHCSREELHDDLVVQFVEKHLEDITKIITTPGKKPTKG